MAEKYFNSICRKNHASYVLWNLSASFRYLNEVKGHIPVCPELLSLSCSYTKM
jgi:hypothetical protein